MNKTELPSATPVSEPTYAPPSGPREMVLPPSNAPATISVSDIKRQADGIYEQGWGRTLPHGGR